MTPSNLIRHHNEPSAITIRVDSGQTTLDTSVAASSTMNDTRPKVLLSGFADEVSWDKSLAPQFSAFAALGLQYLTIRFVNLGDGAKNVMQLSDPEAELIKRMADDHGLSISSLGSPIGKVKLVDVEDGTNSPFCDWDRYRRHEVPRACESAQAFDTRLIRGFSFYPPRGRNPARVSGRSGRTTSSHCRSLWRTPTDIRLGGGGQSGRPGWQVVGRHSSPCRSSCVLLIFDGANLVTQGMNASQVFEQYAAMKPGLGWIHIKDHTSTTEADADCVGGRYVDEDRLCGYVPAGMGGSGYDRILADLRDWLPRLATRLSAGRTRCLL